MQTNTYHLQGTNETDARIQDALGLTMANRFICLSIATVIALTILDLACLINCSAS